MTPLRFHWRLPQGGERENASRALQASLRETGMPDLDPQTRFCHVAEESGIEGLLTDFGWSKPDPILLAAAIGARTKSVNFIVAYRSGLMCPTTFVQQCNTLSALIDGRFSLNVVAGHSPEEQRYYGDFLAHDERYARTEEFLAVCNAFWRADGEVNFEGRYYKVERGRLNTPFVSSRGAKAPELYIAGNSEAARRVAITQGSCWMALADDPAKIAPGASEVLAAGRTVGVRLSMIVRPTRDEALRVANEIAASGREGFDSKAAEDRFVNKADGHGIRAAWDHADRPWLTPYLWTGLVRTHGAAAIAMVGAPDDIVDGLMEFRAAGVTQFIISGWPKLEEMRYFSREVIPRVRAREVRASSSKHPPG